MTPFQGEKAQVPQDQGEGRKRQREERERCVWAWSGWVCLVRQKELVVGKWWEKRRDFWRGLKRGLQNSGFGFDEREKGCHLIYRLCSLVAFVSFCAAGEVGRPGAGGRGAVVRL